MKIRRRTVLAPLTAVLAVLALLLSGCGGTGSQTKTLHVLAAASLTETFTALAKDFEKAHPGVKVDLQFGPSSGLAEQIGQGSPADVFASASATNMDDLRGKKEVESPKDFASNSVEIATPPDNPAGITGVADLAEPGTKVALCQAQVPCGVAAAKVLDTAGVTLTPATEEVDVKAVLTKVTTGEVDAGMVYVTDVKAAGDQVKGITLPAGQNASATYPIAVTSGAKQAALAQDWVDLVLSSKGQRALAEAGFAKP